MDCFVVLFTPRKDGTLVTARSYKATRQSIRFGIATAAKQLRDLKHPHKIVIKWSTFESIKNRHCEKVRSTSKQSTGMLAYLNDDNNHHLDCRALYGRSQL